jgi:hypothetical protein
MNIKYIKISDFRFQIYEVNHKVKSKFIVHQKYNLQKNLWILVINKGKNEWLISPDWLDAV